VDTWHAYRPPIDEEQQTIRVPPSALVTPAQFTVDDDEEEHKMQPPSPLTHSSSSATGVPIHDAQAQSEALPSVWHSLRLAVRALCLSRSSSGEPGGGCHHLKPWWRHLLFLWSTFVLFLLVLYSLSNLLWLLQAHCRDFLVAAVLNAALTFALALLLVALIFQQREQLVIQAHNPFETIGLLDEGSDGNTAEDDEEDAKAEAEVAEAGGFGLQSSIAMRTRRELENEPGHNI
jgi:hypothetical protein